MILQAGANLQTGEKKFEAYFGKATSLERDLLLIASSIFAIDRCVARGEREDLVRGFDVSIPVVNIGRLQPLRPVLEDLLRLLSNDAWRITFRHQAGEPDEESPLGNKPGRTLLFSGGVDSMAAALQLGLEGGALQLVSHTTHNQRISGVQDDLFAMLRELGLDPVHRKFQVSAMSKPPGEDLTFEAESSQRTRSFLFLTLAVLCARRAEHKEVVYIAENGQMAIHLPLTQGRIGAFSTHTAHPDVLAKAQQFFSSATGFSVRIYNPYVHKTKAEVTKIVWDNLKPALAKTISCWKTARLTDAVTHCGFCVPCIIRRVGIEFHGADPTAYARDLFSESFSELAPSDDGRRNLADFGEFVMRISNYPEMEIMTEWPDLYSEEIDAPAVIRMYKRAAFEAKSVLKKYPGLAPILS